MNRYSVVGESVNAMGRSIGIGGELVQQLGKNIVARSDGLSAEHQATLEWLNHNLVMVGNFTSYNSSPEAAEASAKPVADAAAAGINSLLRPAETEDNVDQTQETETKTNEVRMIDPHTVVEVRPLVVDGVDPKIRAGLQLSSRLLAKSLAKNHRIAAVYNSHPITIRPPEADEVTPVQVWRDIAVDLTGLRKQFSEASDYPRQVAVMVADQDDAIELFKSIEFTPADIRNGGQVILRDVDPDPSKNRFLPPNLRVVSYAGERLVRPYIVQREGQPIDKIPN